jgi:acetyltransferase
MFAPQSVAVIGATAREGSVGRAVVENLAKGSCRDRLYLINPKHKELLGLRCYPTIGDVPERVDLAVIVTHAQTVPDLVSDCVRIAVGAVVVISAGFKEQGAAGAQLEREIEQRLCGSKMRLMGPNCLGIMNPITGVNATFAHDMALPGKVALLSQSGALETAILDWSLKEEVGFSAVISTGSMLDVSWGDLIDYFGDDNNTNSIVLYMESVGDARSFVSAARRVALRKPIIVIKVGRSAAASRAASSHTGAMTGSDDVFDAAVRRCGVLRVQTIADLFSMAQTLDRQPRPSGPRLMILTNAGGPGVLATDELIANGGELAPLSDSSMQALNQFLSPNWSHNNPIDVLGDATPEAYARALETAIRDPQSDGLLAILTPQGMTDPTRVAECLKPYARGLGKPVLASWMGGKLVAEGMATLNEAGISTFSYPDTAARAFCYMWQYSRNLHNIYETPSVTEEVSEGDQSREVVARILDDVRRSGRTLLTEVESKQILARYGIPTTDTRLARAEEEAAACARAIGFPVVLKVYSETITHKTDVGGVKLNIANEQEVRSAYREIESSVQRVAGSGKFQGVTVQPMVRVQGYELILGSSVDPQFGPIILFGSGGQLVEVYHDRALALPPLNATLARRLMEQTHIFKALQGVRGRAPTDIATLERVLVRFSTLILEQPFIKEIDINPLLASESRILALDARIVVYGTEIAAKDLPKPAIRPYPVQYVGSWKTKAGMSVLIRPIRPEDEPLMIKFHKGLSDASVYARYSQKVSLDVRVAHVNLVRDCFIDYDQDMALVADFQDPATGEHEILGVGRLTKTRGVPEAEVAVVVMDEYQRAGLGSELIRRLIEIGHKEKLERIVARTVPENEAGKSLFRRFDFEVAPSRGNGTLLFVLDLHHVHAG